MEYRSVSQAKKWQSLRQVGFFDMRDTPLRDIVDTSSWVDRPEIASYSSRLGKETSVSQSSLYLI